MVMVAMRRISLERRIGNREKTEILFQEYIDKASDLNVRAFYVIKYARYMFKVCSLLWHYFVIWKKTILVLENVNFFFLYKSWISFIQVKFVYVKDNV